LGDDKDINGEENLRIKNGVAIRNIRMLSHKESDIPGSSEVLLAARLSGCVGDLAALQSE